MKTEEELSPEARELLEASRDAEARSPMETPENDNSIILGSSLSLGLIEHNGLNKPALIVSTQVAHLLSAESMDAITATLTEMRKGIVIAGAGDMPKPPPLMAVPKERRR